MDAELGASQGRILPATYNLEFIGELAEWVTKNRND